MRATFTPSALAGIVAAPPSKSVAHRLLLCAGLSKGESVIENVTLSEDIAATLDCLKALGVRAALRDKTVTIRSEGLPKTAPAEALPCRECGSTLRFFLPLAMLLPGETKLTGSPRLLSRPLSVYEDICREQKILFLNDGAAVRVGEGLRSGAFTLPGNVSSQFVSGLLFALPLLPGDSVLRLTQAVESRPYIDLTLDALRRFGVAARWEDDATLFVPGGQHYRPAHVTTEGDWSNAAFFFLLRALGHKIEVRGLDEESLQGDRVCVKLLERLQTPGAEIDLSDCPDLGPMLMAAAAAMGNGAVFTGAARLRLKESDRGAAMAEELKKCGVEITVEENRIRIAPGKLSAPTAAIYGHNDHRIVMALSCLLLRTGGALTNAEAVKKSYPDFFDRLKDLTAAIEINEDE